MRWLSAGAAIVALAVVAGAFGAHALEGRLQERDLELWETASRYLAYGGFGLMLVGVATRLLGKDLRASAASLLTGTLVFSGTVFGLALGGPRWLGAVTPIGGVLLIAGFVLVSIAAWRSR